MGENYLDPALYLAWSQVLAVHRSHEGTESLSIVVYRVASADTSSMLRASSLRMCALKAVQVALTRAAYQR